MSVSHPFSSPGRASETGADNASPPGRHTWPTAGSLSPSLSRRPRSSTTTRRLWAPPHPTPSPRRPCAPPPRTAMPPPSPPPTPPQPRWRPLSGATTIPPCPHRPRYVSPCLSLAYSLSAVSPLDASGSDLARSATTATKGILVILGW